MKHDPFLIFNSVLATLIAAGIGGLIVSQIRVREELAILRTEQAGIKDRLGTHNQYLDKRLTDLEVRLRDLERKQK